ncbi:MAG: HMA2 domain-containing protein, partial [Thermodesulfobacteriota bacterium]
MSLQCRECYTLMNSAVHEIFRDLSCPRNTGAVHRRCGSRRKASVVQAIHTAVPGRARYNVDGLYRSEALKKHLEARLAAYEEIHLVSANPVTGNVLVSFNS